MKKILVISTFLIVTISSFAQNTNIKTQKEDNSGVVIASDEILNNPAIRIRTGSREFFLKNRTAVTVKTKSGEKIKSCIKEIHPNYMILMKNATEVNYSDIKKIRIFPHRRFLTRILITSIYPIFYVAQSKSLFMNTSKCKKKIQEIKVVNKYRQFIFGKDDCNLNLK
jgi:hypothetical protein